jgi:hypothetical protein
MDSVFTDSVITDSIPMDRIEMKKGDMSVEDILITVTDSVEIANDGDNNNVRAVRIVRVRGSKACPRRLHNGNNHTLCDDG